MFFEGAPRLVASNVTIPKLQHGDPKRIVVEAYPGVLARQLIGNRSYKQDTRKKQTSEQRTARLDLLDGIVTGRLHNRYGLGIKAQPELCEDPGGDHLDALLCAIQAAWAWQRAWTASARQIELIRKAGLQTPSPCFPKTPSVRTCPRPPHG